VIELLKAKKQRPSELDMTCTLPNTTRLPSRILVTRGRARELLDVSDHQIAKLIKDGELEVVAFGRVHHVIYASLERLVGRRRRSNVVLLPGGEP
jgi:hypothetical protein